MYRTFERTLGEIVIVFFSLSTNMVYAHFQCLVSSAMYSHPLDLLVVWNQTRKHGSEPLDDSNDAEQDMQEAFVFTIDAMDLLGSKMI